MRNWRLFAISFAGRLVVVAGLGFITLPAIAVFIASFNATAIMAFPPNGLSFRWYQNAIAYRDFQHGLKNSLYVALWTSFLALAIGTGFALALNKYEFRFKRTLEAVLLSPLIIPHFTIGLGILLLAAQVHLTRSFVPLILCHVILVLPFVIRSVYISLTNLDKRLELAASSLGASPGKVLTTVTLPLLAPGLAGGWLFAAILSFNEFTGSLFIVSQSTQTLPVAMYNYVREYADPTLAAVAVIYIGVISVLLTIANYYLGLGKVLNVEQDR